MRHKTIARNQTFFVPFPLIISSNFKVILSCYHRILKECYPKSVKGGR